MNDTFDKNEQRDQHLWDLLKKLKDENYLSGVASSEILHAGICKLHVDLAESQET